MNKNNTVIFPYNKIRYSPIGTSQGACLMVPVSMHFVCPNAYLLVVVEVFIKNKLYSRKMKKIFTGECKINKYNYRSKKNIIEHLFIDNFKFYFINDCNPKYIHVEVNTQYIYCLQ